MLSRIRTALAGQYVIERLLGRGASAAVYVARDLKHGRRVALKVIEPDVVNTLGATRFLQEIRTTARLNHPHILPLFDSGEADGCIYFTMPVVDGESLRDRLEREHTLAPAAAVGIARQIAGALSYAHAAGTVHRDIKPENILIDRQEHVWVADFGLARARASAADQRLTMAGASVGSPAYMSPEQAAGESEVDGRSDVYSFGCVLFEMLAGEPPFSAPSVPALLARHISEPAPSLRERRPDAPPEIDAALHRALAKDPAHRFRDASDLAAALGPMAPGSVPVQPVESVRRRSVRPGRRTLRWVAAGLVTVFAAVALAGDRLRLLDSRGAASMMDDSRFLILPIERSDDGPSFDEARLLRGAFDRWRGIDVVGGETVARALERLGSRTPVVDDYAGLGEELRAGRIVQSLTVGFGDSIRVDATLFDRTGSRIATHTVRLSRREPRPDLHFARLADALLFPTVWARDTAPRGTDSHLAQHAYLSGLAAIDEWDLVRADSLFAAAVEVDPGFAHAHAWRAQAEFWLHGATAAMRRAAEQAVAASSGASHSRLLAEALLAMGRGAYPAACARYGRLLGRDPRDYAATRGMADCHSLDELVVPDATSPTAWRFRGSGHQALLHHQRAFELLPASHRAYRQLGFLRLRNTIFYTSVSAHRQGVNEAGERFVARPAWDDTLVFHPVRAGESRPGGAALSATATAAVTHLRRTFLDVTAAWVAAYPQSADALEAHAVAMELAGDTRAIATLERARGYAETPDHQVNLSVSTFWLRLKYALPDAPGDVHRARVLADSILEHDGPLTPLTARRMAAVAAATGRGHRAARLARGAIETASLPRAAAEAGATLLAYAAVGPYVDSLSLYEGKVETAIRNVLRAEQAPRARGELLGRAASLAMPHHRLRFLQADTDTSDYLVAAMVAHADGRQQDVRRILEGVAASRTVFRPADLKIEVLLPEAWLLLELGDPAAALRWLAPTLDDFRYIEPGGLEDMAGAGALPRALLLRAEIEHVMGNAAAAQRWATAAAELWTRADPEVATLKQRAATLANRSGS